MKTVALLYLFLFVAFFDLHAQYPVLSPFAISLGATPAFIGLMMGVYACSHIPGNLLAGRAVDRYGSRIFISTSLILAGFILLIQAFITNPMQLLAARAASGFVLAFLTPACQSLLAQIGKTEEGQGKLMAGSGIVHMLASVIAPGIGALFVAHYGFSSAFVVLGSALILIGFLSQLFLPKQISATTRLSATTIPFGDEKPEISIRDFAVPVAVAFSQAVLYFELPLRGDIVSDGAIHQTGLQFALISLGATTTLSMLFLNRVAAIPRILFGSGILSLLFFVLAFETERSFAILLVLIGMAKGLIYPAISAFLASRTNASGYGRVFAWLAISYSIGAFIGPLVAGQLRTFISPYFLAFLMLGCAFLILTARFDNCQPATYQR